MEYIALYRTYRPKSFAEVIGQNNNITILKNQIVTQKITHAYLFCGTRGTGKTSAAKIFAKAVNCEKNKDGEPCHICNTCKTIENNNIMDIIEIDAASNRGVDEIRELREKVKYPPTIGSYKVYIIDEVHMLTSEAFNALLKTLEEPPKHVIFILATTEPNKLPTTILSRCQRFNFRRIQISDIQSKMEQICKQLNITIEDKTLQLIAKNADGAMRDALSILEQCLSISKENIVSYESVKNLLGISDDHLVYSIIETIVNKDIKSALDYLEEAYKNGKELTQLMNQLILCFRDMLIIKITSAKENLIEASEENIDTLQKLSNQVEKELISYYIESLTDMENKIKFSTLPKVLVEVILIKLCSFNLISTPHKSNQNIKVQEYSNNQQDKKNDYILDNVPKKPIEKKKSLDQVNSKFEFKILCEAIKKESPSLGSSLQMGKFVSITENRVNIEFNEGDTIHLLKVNKNKSNIEQQMNEIFQNEYFLNCTEYQIKEDDELVQITKEVFGADKVYLTEE
ncbi:DNA polymerase III subunit gamma/tau [Alkalibaculum sporogenes]|nr:DNA polymerase III subunit gamma/tau [Alkalibaculum sporogenes]